MGFWTVLGFCFDNCMHAADFIMGAERPMLILPTHIVSSLYLSTILSYDITSSEVRSVLHLHSSPSEDDRRYFVPGNNDLPAALLASRAPLRQNAFDTPSMRCVELMFLTRVI